MIVNWRSWKLVWQPCWKLIIVFDTLLILLEAKRKWRGKSVVHFAWVLFSLGTLYKWSYPTLTELKELDIRFSAMELMKRTTSIHFILFHVAYTFHNSLFFFQSLSKDYHYFLKTVGWIPLIKHGYLMFLLGGFKSIKFILRWLDLSKAAFPTTFGLVTRSNRAIIYCYLWDFNHSSSCQMIRFYTYNSC